MTLALFLAWAAFVGAIVTWLCLAKNRDPGELPDPERTVDLVGRRR